MNHQNLSCPRQGHHQNRRIAVSLLLTLLAGVPACQQQMGTTPAYKPLTKSDFFADGRASRPVLTGTVARGQLWTDSALFEGRNEQGALVEEFPFEITTSVLERGKQRYDIFCSVCHGLTGHGDGRIVKRGFTVPPNYMTDLSRGYQLKGIEKKLTDVPVGYIYEVITKGYGAMPDHASQIPVRDRWAIVGYVKALQFSQLPELRTRMQQAEKGEKK